MLTLTATPIPRTLEMSLTGIRDLSLVNTPPEDRQPILTYVGELRRARGVGGDPARAAARGPGALRAQPRAATSSTSPPTCGELVPEARVAVAHGQMDEGRLERVVQEFWEHEHDVLVCTTIVESGLDMPTVNTLVVDRADMLGLAQLYQLRGRVGRRGQRAYAYLLYPRRPHAHRGGVRAAEDDRRVHRSRLGLQDRDARPRDPRRGQPARRGAVGPHRRGRLRPLRRDGDRGRGRAHRRGAASSRPRCRSTCRSPRTCPRDYIARDDVRMEAYRRLAAVTTPADVDDVRAEWADRYGPPPPPAAVLLDVARLRAECLRLGHPGGVGAEGPRPPRRLAAAQVAGSAAASGCSDRSQVLPDAVVVPVTRRADVSLPQAILRLLSPRSLPPNPLRYAPPNEDVSCACFVAAVAARARSRSACSSTLSDAATITLPADGTTTTTEHVSRSDLLSRGRARSSANKPFVDC